MTVRALVRDVYRVLFDAAVFEDLGESDAIPFRAANRTGRPLVAYCRGPYCAFARDAVDRLREAGHDAYRSDIGVAQWRAASLPLETAEPPRGAGRAI